MELSISNHVPLLSVGLPVYNGEKYLAQAIEAILAQTFRDFELIISDNGSTDATATICQKFVKNDSRVRYSRNSENLGVAANYNRTVHLARGEFFRWATYDDLMAPELFEKCIEVLEENPKVILCYPRTINIDDDGNDLGDYVDDFSFLDDDPVIRFKKVMRRIRDYDCNAEYGVIRRNVLLKTAMEADYHSADKVLLSELVLHGHFCEVPHRLYFHRLHEGGSTKLCMNDSEWAAWFNPSSIGKRSYPRSRRLVEFIKGINRSQLNFRQRVLCYFEVFRFYLDPEKWNRLLERTLKLLGK